MRPDELLRRYLEQRRDLGESDLVLDSMSVDEVMRILGARAARGAAPSQAPPAERADAPPAAPARPPAAPPPPAPRMREVDLPATSDWREALRASGGEPKAADRPRVEARAEEESSREARRAGPPVAPPEPDPTRSEPVAPRRSDFPAPAARSAPSVAPDGLVVGESGTGLFGGPLAHVDSIGGIAELVAKCTRCPLYATALNPVPGEGSAEAKLVCVGEAPGANEDETGRPFVGQAGQLLTKILAAIDLRRDDVFICNVLKHRPPGNRNPRPEEVDACKPYLIRQIELIRPKVILAFGTFAAQTLLETKLAIGKLRGQVHRYHGVPLVVTYHPAALLRNPAWKRPTWEDVQLARRILDSAADA